MSHAAALHEDLSRLRHALEREDFRQAGDVLARHDQRLCEYIETVGLQSPLLALRALLQLQHAHSPMPGVDVIHPDGRPA